MQDHKDTRKGAGRRISPGMASPFEVLLVGLAGVVEEE